MMFNEDEAVDVFSDDYWQSAYRMKDIVFEIMLSGVTSLEGIAMELNRQGCWGNEWRAVDVRKLLSGD
jgi:hypothetical protein